MCLFMCVLCMCLFTCVMCVCLCVLYVCLFMCVLCMFLLFMIVLQITYNFWASNILVLNSGWSIVFLRSQVILVAFIKMVKLIVGVAKLNKTAMVFPQKQKKQQQQKRNIKKKKKKKIQLRFFQPVFWCAQEFCFFLQRKLSSSRNFPSFYVPTQIQVNEFFNWYQSKFIFNPTKTM